MLRETQNLKKDELRNQLESDVAEFLSRGGEITEAKVEDNKWYRDQQKKRRKSRAGDHPMRVDPRRTGRGAPFDTVGTGVTI